MIKVTVLKRETVKAVKFYPTVSDSAKAIDLAKMEFPGKAFHFITEDATPHGNTGKRNAAKPNPKQSLTIRIPAECRERALSEPGGASAYIEWLIRTDTSTISTWISENK